MQKTALIALALIGTLTAGFFLFKSHKTEVNTSELKNIYNQWKLSYNINVGAAEDDYRFGVFSANYAKIQEHNRHLDRTYTLGLNAFSHLTAEEFSATHLGFKGSKSTRKVTVLPTSSIPAKVDWRSKMNAVQDQGQCGSCWAFSATASFEALNAIKFGDMTKHAEQDLVDCAGDYGNQGCDGGMMDYAFEYMIANGGLATEADYPYTASDGTCDTSVKRSGIIKSYTDVEQNSAAALKAAIAQQPVSVAIEADTTIFQSYSSGVITSKSCGTDLDHGVVAVGYDTTGKTPYYIVRNSWSASWGQEGYVNIAIVDGVGICGIQMDPSYPTA